MGMDGKAKTIERANLVFLRLHAASDVQLFQDRLASWVYDTDRELFDWIFDGMAAAREGLRTSVTRPNSEFSGTQATVLLVDGQPAGATIAWPGVECSARHRADTLALIQRCGPEQRQALKQRLSAIQGASTALVRPDDWYIRSLALEPERRGCGLSRPLLDRCLEDGTAAGCRRARLEVRAGNTAAVRLYLKAGFTVIEESTDPHFGWAVYSMLREH